jgi:hypothetical protein
MLPLALLLAGSASAAPIRVTCVGDSITIHACASNDTMPYPQQLGPSRPHAHRQTERRPLPHCCVLTLTVCAAVLASRADPRAGLQRL